MQLDRQMHAHTHLHTISVSVTEPQLHLRYGSGQHRYDEEGALLTVLLVEQHQTVV